MNYIPKIEYGLGPTLIIFQYPPEGDYLNTNIDASETTTRSFNGKIQTTWGYNQQELNPKFKLIGEDIKKNVETFFNSYASTGGIFKYFPDKTKADFYICVSKTKKFTPKILTVESVDMNTQLTKFYWEFDLPMLVVDPGTFAVGGAPVTSVNTRVGDVYVAELYSNTNGSGSIIAQGTPTGLDAKIFDVADTSLLLNEKGRIAFTNNDNKFKGYNGSSWQEFGNITGPVIATTTQAVALYSDTTGTKLDQTAYTLPLADGTVGQVLKTDGAGVASWTTDLTNTGDVVGPSSSIINQLAQYSDTTGKLIKATAWTVPNVIGTLGQYLAVGGAQDLVWTAFPSEIVYVGGAPVIVGDIPVFGGTAGTQIVDSGIASANVFYASGGTQAVVAGGQITLTVAPKQTIELTAITPISLALNIFIIPANYIDKSEVTLIGTNDTNKITIVSNDVANGQIMFGNINIKKYTSITYTWLESTARFVEKCRNSQFIITNP